MSPPPWHYAGRVMSLAVEVDPDTAGRFLPGDFGDSTGRAYGHFCDWQATSNGAELLDPAYAQYKEFFYLLEAERNGERRLFCPFIYVDQDIAMVRGLLQGWPKKIGSVWITRSYGFDHPAAARIGNGIRLGASLAVKDRRLAEARIELTGEPGERIGFLAIPTFGIVGEPTLVGGPDRGRQRLVRQAVSHTSIGTIHGAKGELKLFESPWDELGQLVPACTREAAICEFALTVTGAMEAMP